MKRMKYNACPHCGAHLDFGERCDCQQERRAAEARKDGEQFAGDKPAVPSGKLPRRWDKAIGA